jgi:hypothetical protein
MAAVGAMRADELTDRAEDRLDELLAAIDEPVSAIELTPGAGLPAISLALDVAGTRPRGPNPLPAATWQVISTGVLKGLATAGYRPRSIKAELAKAATFAVVAAALVADRSELDAHDAIDTAYGFLASANRPRLAGG